MTKNKLNPKPPLTIPTSESNPKDSTKQKINVDSLNNSVNLSKQKNKPKFIREGGYGDVYKILIDVSDNTIKTTTIGDVEDIDTNTNSNNKMLAVKRNYISPRTDFIGSIRELNFLAQLNHPHIVEYKKVYRQKELELKKNKHLLEYGPSDSIYLVMEYGIRDGVSLMDDSRMSWKYKKKIIMELLLGLEYMSAMQVAHLDIKVANFIQVKDKDGSIKAKWCDFGSTIWLTNQIENETEKVTTYTYRPPEIAFGKTNYDTKADIWSFGIVIISILTKNEMTLVNIDKQDVSNKVLARYLINRVPEKITSEDLSYLDPKKKIIRNFNHKKHNKKRPTLKNIIKFDEISKFNKTQGSYDDLLDLLSKLIVINPEKRWSATQALKHKFFDFGRKYIDKISNETPKSRPGYQLIVEDLDRSKWAKYYFDILSKINPKLYPYRVMFHALDLYDRAIESKLNLELGDLLIEDMVVMCGYLALKLIVDNYDINYMSHTFEIEISKEKYRLMESLEYEFACNKLGGKLYRDTPFEMVEYYKLTKEDLFNLYNVYSNLPVGTYAPDKLRILAEGIKY